MTKKISNSKLNWLTPQMRLYVISIFIKQGKEIKCEKCGTHKNLEFHHKSYRATLEDIELLCNKCHRNSDKPYSQVSTVFEKGKRYCVGSNFKIAY